MKELLALAAVMALGAGITSAQTEATKAVPAQKGEKNVVFFQSGQIQAFHPVSKPITNSPYQAVAENETTQHLVDGNIIHSTQTTRMARDKQGRTRTEQTIEKLGPWSSNEGPKEVIFISDPVAGTTFILHPDSKTAERTTMRPGNGPRISPPGAIVTEVAPALPAMPALPALPAGATTAIAAGPGTTRIFETVDDSSASDKTEESLGTQQINGVKAEGKKITITIPADTVGNQLPLVTTIETWYSPQLQTVVKSKRSDPRFGETTYELKNIQLSDPPASLFQVPSDYNISDAHHFAVPLNR
jgi:hypothetical protein